MKKSQLQELVREVLSERQNTKIDAALDQAFSQLGKEFSANKDKIVSNDNELNEAGIALGVGIVLSGPEIAKIIGKITKVVGKFLGGNGATGEKIINWAEHKHHQLLNIIVRALKMIPGVSKSNKVDKLAKAVLNLVIAGLLVHGGISMAGKIASGNLSGAALKGAMNAVKAGELVTYIRSFVG